MVLGTNMMYRPLGWLLILCLSLCSGASFAWTSVGDGIEYQEFTASGPNRCFVTRLIRSNTNACIESCIGQGRLSGGNETIPGQASRYDDAINFWNYIWGQRNDVIVAINGDFTEPDDTDVPYGGQIQSGWYAKRFNNNTGDSGFAWKLDRSVFIDDCVTHVAAKQIVTYADATTQAFQDINVARPANSMIIYTPHYDQNTLTDNTGVEVVVELIVRPMLIIPTPNKVVGYVRQIRQNQGSTPIPFDHVVLSAVGTAATTLLSKVHIGDEIGISNETGNCGGGTSMDWSKAYASVGGNYIFLRNGTIFDGGTDPGLTLRNPRTAIAYNAAYVFFVVVDGRDPGVSEGMTMTEIANFCKNTLGATDGVNNDGGGSSTMVVNGVVKNNPSDGSLRAVPNGIMMINVLPRLLSTAFTAGQAVKTTSANVAVRMGPGTNCFSLTTVGNNTQGTIVDHQIKGVYAKSYYWWKVDFGGSTVGWVGETLLTSACTPITVSVGAPSAAMTTTGPVTCTVTYTNTDTITLTSAHVTLNKTGTANGTVSVSGTGNTTRTVTVSGTTGDGTLGISIAAGTATGCGVAPAAGPSATFLVDNTPPSTVAVTDQGTWTPSLSTLSASWTTASDTGSGINRYEYAIGIIPSSQGIKSWTSVSASTSMTDSSLTLTEGSQYFVQARAVDNVGLPGTGSAADGVTVAPGVTRIGSAWLLPNSVGLSLRDKVVTGSLGGAFWLEETDRSAAIKVVSFVVKAPGDKVSVAGVLGTSGTQRALIGDVVQDATDDTAPDALVLVQRDLGGSSVNLLTPGVTDGKALYNIGLLVTCFGSVTYSNADNPADKYFYFDDGSGLSDGGTHTGVLVRSGAVNPPTSGMVKVTGIVTSETAPGKTVPVLVIRSSADIITF